MPINPYTLYIIKDHFNTLAGKALKKAFIDANPSAKNLVEELSDENIIDSHLTDRRKRYKGKCLAIIAPETVSQCQLIIKIAKKQGLKIVAQGGNSGLVGGATPFKNNEILLLTKYLNKIREINKTNMTMIAEAGVTLTRARHEAEKNNLNLPIKLGANTSATIGGNVSTNAGGVYAIRQGVTRRHVLSLEAISSAGEVINNVSQLHKDNCGYNLSQLFTGAEGTLALITAASLKLEEGEKYPLSCLCEFSSLDDAMSCFLSVRKSCRGMLNAAEIIHGRLFQQALKDSDESKTLTKDTEGAVNFDKTSNNWIMILETINGDWLIDTFKKEIKNHCDNFIIPASVDSCASFNKKVWAIRDKTVHAQSFFGHSLKHDISLPIDAIPKGIALLFKKLEEQFPFVMAFPFGHLGDGNLHFNVFCKNKNDSKLLKEKEQNIATTIFETVINLGGSTSAEHGIGKYRQDRVSKQITKEKIMAMKKIKNALDPDCLFNQDKLFPSCKTKNNSAK